MLLPLLCKPIMTPRATSTSAGAASVLAIPQAASNPRGLLPLDFCSKCHHAADTGASLAAGKSKQLPA